MPILGDGRFTFTIGAPELAKGLRPSKRNPRNSKYLTECRGAVGYDNVLQVLSALEEDRVDTHEITDDFPFPQLFVFPNVIILCSETDIYELVAGSLVNKITVTAGIEWSAVAFFDYVYLSNGKVVVVRDTGFNYSLSTSLPIASTICDFNGQVLIGAPDVEWT